MPAGGMVILVLYCLHDLPVASAVAGGAPAPLTPPDRLASWPLSNVWPGGYIASLDVRPLAAPRPGRTAAWISTDLDLVAGLRCSPLASYVALVDTANGIAVRQPPPTAWMFPHVDLTLHLHRTPEGRWTGLDTTVTFGAAGQGVTTTVLHDIHRPVGHAQQILTVRPQPATTPPETPPVADTRPEPAVRGTPAPARGQRRTQHPLLADHGLRDGEVRRTAGADTTVPPTEGQQANMRGQSAARR